MVERTYAKHRLPNYGVFDERRLFEPGDEPCVIEVDGVVVSIAICEDLWEPDSPPQLAAAAGADVLLVINASPFEQGKHHQRLALCQTRADQTGGDRHVRGCGRWAGRVGIRRRFHGGSTWRIDRGEFSPLRQSPVVLRSFCQRLGAA
ncbi:MAG: nitrilase-related carbon-nitrogen hydrolase [Candidatus Nanopelagicales bacterium]